MEKLDKLRWSQGFSRVSHDVLYGVRVNDPDLLPILQGYLPPGSRPSSRKVVNRCFSLIKGGSEGRRRNYNLFYVNHTLYGRSFDLDDVLHRFETYVGVSVADMAPAKVFIHAGVVALEGKAILLPGQSYCGKSRLVAELVKAGATYYSDEYAVVDLLGRVHPYARPLSLRNDSGPGRRRVPVAEIGGRTGVAGLPVGLIVMTGYREGARWALRRLSRGRGVLALLEHTVSARTAPERAMAVLERLVSGAPVLSTARGEAAETVPLVFEAAAKATTESGQPVRAA